MTPEFARQFLEQYAITIRKPEEEKEILKLLAEHIHILVYNVASVAAVMTLLHAHKKITPAHLVEVRQYIESKCPLNVGQSGGTTPYWPKEASLAVSSEANLDTSLYNPLASGATRPAMGPDLLTRLTGGSQGSVQGGAPADPKMVKAIKAVLKQHDLKISKEALTELLSIVQVHLACVVEDLRRNDPLTLSKMKKVLGLKRHAIFH